MVESIDSEDDELTLEDDINQPKSESTQPTTRQEIIARSMIDLLSCPSCDQSLKVPIERRPVKARCPACRSEFLAEVGE